MEGHKEIDGEKEIEVDKENNINMILRQTDYTYEEARDKLEECNNDPILTIKNFLGISVKERKVETSINQEIYKQLRVKMNSCKMYVAK
jgi:hypothetical protein